MQQLSNLSVSKIKNYVYKRWVGYRVSKIRVMPRKQPGVFTFHGYSVCYLDPLSFYHQFKDIFQDKVYHFQAQTQSPVILDVGGCIGMSALYFKKLYPLSKITTFEPDPTIFHVLQNNIKTNNITDVTIINAAVGKTVGEMTFYPDGIDGGSQYPLNGITPTKVNIVPLSNYITGPIDLLKLDIEGMEGEVFEEIESKLHLVREIVFEYHDFYNVPQSLGKILSMLESKGYAYLVADATNVQIPRPFSLPSNYRYLNLVYAKKVR